MWFALIAICAAHVDPCTAIQAHRTIQSGKGFETREECLQATALVMPFIEHEPGESFVFGCQERRPEESNT